MKKGLSRRELFACSGAALGTALVGGTAVRAAVPTESVKRAIRWGIAVDLDRCASRAGCRACIEACHSAHQVPQIADLRHEVKWVWKEPFLRVFPEQIHPWDPDAHKQKPVLVLCNHCTQSPCTRVCPTGATWRRADGVVAMDDHRCIGCRYCMAACPYGARSFNWEQPGRNPLGGQYPTRSAGVVEKCNLCIERIDLGQAPLCVETCRSSAAGALTFGDLEDPSSPIRQLLSSRQVLRRRPALGTEPRVFYLI
jgi:Fe-S-cluster-containing dehydrogenase component